MLRWCLTQLRLGGTAKGVVVRLSDAVGEVVCVWCAAENRLWLPCSCVEGCTGQSAASSGWQQVSPSH